MANTLFIGDTHFYHNSIIKTCHRPFKTVEEMNQCMITKWNKVVKPTDTVYHLGDVFLTRSSESREIIQHLNGHKILILGNHDTKTPGWYKMAGFQEVHKMLYLTSPTQPGAIKYLITHYPVPHREIEALESMGDAKIINIHAHTHNSTDRSFTGNDIWDYPMSYICVSVEKTQYQPVQLDL